MHADTARHCNFNLVSGDMTGTYRFKTGFYCQTDMQAEFQKAVNCTLTGFTNIFCFLDDILILNRGRIEDHLHLVRKSLTELDEENRRINLAKCKFAKYKIEWLGHRIIQSRITPLATKTTAIQQLTSPTNLKNEVHLWASFITLVDLYTIYPNFVILYDHY